MEEGLDRNLSIRKIADEVGKSVSTVHDEVMRHRFVTSPMARYGDPTPRDLEVVCARLGRWPGAATAARGVAATDAPSGRRSTTGLRWPRGRQTRP
ncbi:helix-turn-helix domain-containing protein [Olsenella absiana]|uniref:helix-turn-helix domain-containing protein n=1 Tax=Olsenella absiana TaxID=3115222 RepID=UPI0038B28630